MTNQNQSQDHHEEHEKSYSTNEENQSCSQHKDGDVLSDWEALPGPRCSSLTPDEALAHERQVYGRFGIRTRVVAHQKCAGIPASQLAALFD